MSDYDNTVSELTEKLTGLGGIVTQVTDDPTLVKPSPGKASIWIEPPDFTWEGWHPYPPEITIKLMVTVMSSWREPLLFGMNLAVFRSPAWFRHHTCAPSML